MTKQAMATVVGGVVLFAVAVAASFGVVGDSDSGGSVPTATDGVMTMPDGSTMPQQDTGTMPGMTGTGGPMTMPGGETMPTADMGTTGGQTTNEMPGMEMP